jgi:hypothetical protein
MYKKEQLMLLVAAIDKSAGVRFTRAPIFTQFEYN